MTTMNISLTDDLKIFVEQQVAEHSFASTSEYVRAVLRRERDILQLRDKVLAGATGPYQPMDKAYFSHLRTGISDRATQS